MYQYPYGNAQQLNLDWLMEQWQEVKQSIDGSLQGEIDRVEAAITDLLAARDAAAASAAAAGTSATAAAQSAQAAAADAATASAQAAAANTARSNAAQAANNAQTYANTAQTQATAAATSASQAAASASDANDDALAASGSATNAATSAAGALQNFQLSDTARQAAQAAAQEAQAVLDSIPEDYSEMSDDVSDLKTALIGHEDIISLKNNIPIDFTIDSVNGFIRYDTGANIATNSYKHTDYVDISLYKKITYKRLATTGTSSTQGMAFYDSEKTYISGIRCLTRYSSETYVIDTANVPNNAVYARFTIYTDTTTYGNFELSGTSILYDEINDDGRIANFVSRNKTKNQNVLKPTAVTYYGCSGYYSTEYTADMDKSIYGVASSSGAVDLRVTTDSFTLNKVAAIKVVFYVPDITKISTVSLIIGEGAFSEAVANLKAGWNEVVFYTFAGNLPQSDTYSAFRFVSSGSDGNAIYLAKVVLYSVDKGNLIIIEDGGYDSFLSNAYDTLLSMGVPVTWALNPDKVGATGMITQNDIDALAIDGNSEFSFHSWNPNTKATADMTAAEIQEDVAKCLRYLKANGLEPAHIWRAAHVQNTAPNASAEIGMVEALATSTGRASMNVFPFRYRWDVPRIALHSQSTSDMDTLFNRIKLNGATMVCYTHGISSSSYDMTAENFSYFASKIQTGITEGWLRPTTYSRLMDTPEVWLDLS